MTKPTENTKIGARILVEELESLGVEIIFGYPGGQILPVFDELKNSKIKVILNGDERCCGHAAEGFSRATGKPAVCVVTSGPGATNLVTPLADAKMDSTPIIGISGNVASHLIGKDAFQETPIVNVTMQITKHNFLVTKASDIARRVQEAFYIATTGRPGPVLVDITRDAQAEHVPVDKIKRDFKLKGYHPEQFKVDSAKVEELATRLAHAHRPVIYAGQGVIMGDAVAELKELAEKTHIPVATTMLGLGAFPASHPLNIGMLGMHGPASANYAMDQADVVLVLGARFDDRVTGRVGEFIKEAYIAHVDLDPSEINKIKRVNLGIAAPVKDVLRELIPKAKHANTVGWLKAIDELKAKYPMTFKDSTDGTIKPQYFLQRLHKATRGRRTIFTTSVGQHQMWAAQYLPCEEPRTHITSGGAGTMGFGLPAAVGAQFGRPDSLVVDIDGDGSFEMNLGEMRTLADHNLPVKVCILNNKILGMVGQWQRRFFKAGYSASEFKADYPDFAAGAKAMYHIEGARISRHDEVDSGIEKMIKHDGPYILEIMIPKEEDVLPMIPAGMTVRDTIHPD